MKMNRTATISLLAIVVLALLVWGFWPENEAEAYARIQPIMSSTDPEEWYDANPGGDNTALQLRA